jgi:uncharacterized protein (DUF1015 family)
MAEIRGFRAFRFDQNVVGDLNNVITPPFDVISPEEREALAARGQHNMAHVLLPEKSGESVQYEAAAKRIESWVAEGALRQDDADSFYLLEQRFKGMDGNELVRRGFFGALKIPEPGEADVILGHERTFERKIADRLQLTAVTRANLGSVFALYDDPDGALAPFLAQMDTRSADAESDTIDGATQRLWRVPQDERVQAFLRERMLYIADGHHRFATACRYRDDMRAKGGTEGLQEWDYVLMGFVAFQDPGLVVWPTHRLLDPPDGFDKDGFLEALAPWFDVELTDDLATRVDAAPGCAIGLALHRGGQYLLSLRDDADRAALVGTDRSEAWRGLDVTVLHRGIIERILGLKEGAEFVYDPKPDTSLAAVDAGAKGMAFLVKATRTDQIRACAEARDYMPEKATYFYPKLPSGAVIHRM